MNKWKIISYHCITQIKDDINNVTIYKFDLFRIYTFQITSAYISNTSKVNPPQKTSPPKKKKNDDIL